MGPCANIRSYGSALGEPGLGSERVAAPMKTDHQSRSGVGVGESMTYVSGFRIIATYAFLHQETAEDIIRELRKAMDYLDIQRKVCSSSG